MQLIGVAVPCFSHVPRPFVGGTEHFLVDENGNNLADGRGRKLIDGWQDFFLIDSGGNQLVDGAGNALISQHLS
jgi:hypothetical protein